MGVTVARSSIGVALACAAVATLVLPFPDTPRHQWTSAAPGPLAAEMARLVRASGNAYAAVRRYRSMQALTRWHQSAERDDTTLIRIDASVPMTAQAPLRALIAEQWTAVSPRASAAHAQVFVYLDSSSIPRGERTESKKRALEPRKFVDISFALPEAVDGARCVTIVRLRGVSDAHIDALRNESVVGVCAFFAAFGPPGSEIRSWLAAQHYRFARRSDWSVARAPAIDASSMYALGDRGGRCLTGTLGACESALGLEQADSLPPRIAGDRLSAVLDATRAGQIASDPSRPTLGDVEGELFADMVRDIGPERFQRFWRSDSAPNAAFLAATGEPFAMWTERWLNRVYGPAPSPPAPRVRDIVWVALAIGLASLVAARPRQAVLAERLRAFGV